MSSNSREQDQQTCGILARWYATPLDHLQAESLKQQAVQRRKDAIKRSPERGTVSRTVPLMEAIADFWLTGELSAQLDSPASPLHRSAHGRILAQTIRGQLLISRQLVGGLDALKQSFKLAAPLLKAEDYFLLMDRYKCLENVPLGKIPQSGLSLTELLNLGGVVGKLQDRDIEKGRHDPTDLYG